MARFISKKNVDYYPQVNDTVKGKCGKHEYIGKVLPSTKDKRKPAIFQRYGVVLLYIQTETGRKVAINEIEKVNNIKLVNNQYCFI